MESWQNVWRNGIVPELSVAALKALRKALIGDDKRLVQGATTVPPPLACVSDWPVEAACILGFCGWTEIEKTHNGHVVTVGNVEAYFADLCFKIDQRLGEPAASRWFLSWADDADREEMRWLLLGEVDLAIDQKYILLDRVMDECRPSVVIVEG